ncbi:hypothetical protein [Chlorogloeopsis sp. ULAP02]|uniref:hypothetical protein n=1 Tax=Chlorogloeopsis sp. ULAP02 TaxID=3107926 RepID=UPI0031358E60
MSRWQLHSPRKIAKENLAIALTLLISCTIRSSSRYQVQPGNEGLWVCLMAVGSCANGDG